MTLNEYYDIIIDKYNSGDYNLKVAKTQTDRPEVNEKEFPLYALNYMIFEYLKDNKDDRWKLLLDFILVPNGINQEGCDVDFTEVDFEEFFYFMLSVKS
jgi:hypothetical protein